MSQDKCEAIKSRRVIGPGLHADGVTLLYGRHYKASSSVKVHLNTLYSVTYKIV